MVRGLLVAVPWVPDRAPLLSMSFQPVGGLAKLVAGYERFDKDRSQALWESTQSL